jgi:hypothetical protein
MEHSEEREKDLQKLCKAILDDNYSRYHENDRDGEYWECPFCGNESSKPTLEEMPHNPNCAYLIAKDLSTNMIYPLTIIALIIFIACGMEAVKQINNSL